MLNAVGHDGMVVHDMVTGPGAERFLTDLHTHQWQDDGQAARSLFGSARRSAAALDPGDPTTVALATRGAEIARAEAAFLAQHGRELVDVDGTLRSLGETNPMLVGGLAPALEPLPWLGQDAPR